MNAHGAQVLEMEEAITKQTRLDRQAPAVVYPHARGALEVAKADGSETLVVDRVRIVAAKGGAKCGSLAEFDALGQHREGWPNGYGLAVSPSSYRSLRKDCDPVGAPSLSPSRGQAEPESEG